MDFESRFSEGRPPKAKAFCLSVLGGGSVWQIWTLTAYCFDTG
jgi:hypothetical protein